MVSVVHYILTLLILKIVSGQNKVTKINADTALNGTSAPPYLNLKSESQQNALSKGVTVQQNTKLRNVPQDDPTDQQELEPRNVQLNQPTDQQELEPRNALLDDEQQEMEPRNAPLDEPNDEQGLEPRNVSVELADQQEIEPKNAPIGDKSSDLNDVFSSGPDQVIPMAHLSEEFSPQQKITMNALNWPMGVVPYYVNRTIFDDVAIDRMTKSMEVIESLSCILFTEIKHVFEKSRSAWLHITNPNNERECVHHTADQPNSQGEIIVVIGFDCMRPEEILHTLLHGIGLQDEVTHPHRDQYIRILWENIQPKYRPLYGIRHLDQPHKIAEYDPASIMHFHDRAFSANGAPTIAALIPGLMITPSRSLSQLDVMKLQLEFGHGCKKRQVDGLFDTCKSALPVEKRSKKSKVSSQNKHRPHRPLPLIVPRPNTGTIGSAEEASSSSYYEQTTDGEAESSEKTSVDHVVEKKHRPHRPLPLIVPRPNTGKIGSAEEASSSSYYEQTADGEAESSEETSVDHVVEKKHRPHRPLPLIVPRPNTGKIGSAEEASSSSYYEQTADGEAESSEETSVDHVVEKKHRPHRPLPLIVPRPNNGTIGSAEEASSSSYYEQTTDSKAESLEETSVDHVDEIERRRTRNRFLRGGKRS